MQMAKITSNNLKKSVVTMGEFVKDSVVADLSRAAAGGSLHIDKRALQQLVLLVGSSIEQAYHQALKGFEKDVSNMISAEVKANTVIVPVPDKKKAALGSASR